MTLVRRDLLMASAAALPSLASATQTLEWVAADLPPFAWSAPGGPRGFAHELAMAMASRLGRTAQVSYVPWARAVRMTELGHHYGIFPLARTPDREAKFQWLVPLLTVRFGIYTLATPSRLDRGQLRALRVGVLRGSPTAANLRADGFRSLVEARDYRELLRLLLARMLDAVYAGAPMLEAAMDRHGHPRDQFALQATLGESTLYMAASRGLGADEAQRWVGAYRQLEDDGTVARLRRQYRL